MVTGPPGVIYGRQVTRARRPGDWERDLSAARAVEAEVAARLRADPRVAGLTNRTGGFDLDFEMTLDGRPVALDVKEKRQPYSAGLRRLWPEVAPPDLFVLDETVYRRIVWRGGGGYLAVHDVPSGRWVLMGPWELTLGPRVRYARWGRRHRRSFLKGKLLVDLGTGLGAGESFTVDALAELVERTHRWHPAVEPYPVGPPVPELGGPLR